MKKGGKRGSMWLSDRVPDSEPKEQTAEAEKATAKPAHSSSRILGTAVILRPLQGEEMVQRRELYPALKFRTGKENAAFNVAHSLQKTE